MLATSSPVPPDGTRDLYTPYSGATHNIYHSLRLKGIPWSMGHLLALIILQEGVILLSRNANAFTVRHSQQLVLQMDA